MLGVDKHPRRKKKQDSHPNTEFQQVIHVTSPEIENIRHGLSDTGKS